MGTKRLLIGLTFGMFIVLFLNVELMGQTVLARPDSLYLGKIPTSSTSTRKVEIKNTSSTALNITQIEVVGVTGGNFTILDNPGATSLGQLQSITLEIQFTPTAAGMSTANLQITSNAGTSPNLVFLFGEGTSGSPITFERLFGDEENDQLNSIEETPDGGYICAGATLPPGEDFYNALVVKIDQYGLVEWFKSYGDDETEDEGTVVQAGDGNYLVLGRTDSFGAGGFDYYLFKINSTGDLLWEKTYGGDRDEQARFIVKTPDGNYLLLGNSRSFGDGFSTDIYVIKVNPDGTTIWEKTYGGAGGESPSKVIITNDDNFVIVGNTGSIGGGGFDAYFLKIDGSGNQIWEKTFGGTEDEDASDISELSDGSLVAVGYTVSYGEGGRDIFLVKLNSSGDEIWHKTYGGIYQDYGANVIANGDNIIFTGTVSETLGAERTSIFNVNSEGDIISQFTSHPGELNMVSNCLIINSAGNLILAGSSGSFSLSGDAYVLNTADYNTATAIDDNYIITKDFVLHQNYPNPFNPTTTIQYQVPESGKVLIRVFDVLGQEVATLVNGFKSAGSYSVEFIGKNLTSGIYLYSIEMNGKVITKKMVLLK